MFCLKIPFTENLLYKNHQSIFKANQLTGFHMKGVCTERYFRIDYNRSRIMSTSLDTVLNCIILNNLSQVNLNPHMGM